MKIPVILSIGAQRTICFIALIIVLKGKDALLITLEIFYPKTWIQLT
jgi:hypothetical protein